MPKPNGNAFRNSTCTRIPMRIFLVRGVGEAEGALRVMTAAAQEVSDVVGDAGFRKVVLEEEEYVSRLSRVIQRDFFPDAPEVGVLPETKLVKKRKGKKLVNVSDAALSVDGFQRYYTSEDNASFETLQAKAIKLSEERYRKRGLLLKDKEKPLTAMLLGDGRHDSGAAAKDGSKRQGKETEQKDGTRKRKRIDHSETRFSQDVRLGNLGLLTYAESVTTEQTAQTGDVNGYSYVLDPSFGESIDRHRYKIARRNVHDEIAFRLGQAAGMNISRRQGRAKGSQASIISSTSAISSASAGKPTLSVAGASLARRLLKSKR